MRISAVILTYNEARHILRCIHSIKNAVDEIVVVDSFSQDDTVKMARDAGAKVLQREWVNYADQFNWAMLQVSGDTNWILRIDADEYIDARLSNEISRQVRSAPQDCSGMYVKRRMKFLGEPVRFGGVFPVQVVRVFRVGRGRCEARWMDEHIKVDGLTTTLEGALIDDNLNSLSWWTAKHNSYASREVVDLLNIKYRFIPTDSVADLDLRREDLFKRWIKERVYSGLPLGFRAFLYFFYRYVLRFGFLDGRRAAQFHFLQGLWYRYLVDAKLAEVESLMVETRIDAPAAIEQVLGIKV